MRCATVCAILSLSLTPDLGLAQIVRDDSVCWDEICRPIYKEGPPAPRPSPRPIPPPNATVTPAPGAKSVAPRVQTQRPQLPSEKVAFQISRADPGLMNLALNNAENIIQHYKNSGRSVEIEIVAYGPGLQMVRLDASPVGERLVRLIHEQPQSLRVRACAQTIKEQERTEEHKLDLLKGVTRVDLGIAHLVKLQETGYRALRP